MGARIPLDQRVTLSLGVEGVSRHEEVLIKSMVKLLNYRTEHNWIFDNEKADLWILGESSPQCSVSTGEMNVMRVDHHNGAEISSYCLRFPIHAQAFEAQLNSLGVQILLRRQDGAGKGAPPSLPDDESLMLLRWPPAALLRTPQRVKLATLMTRHSVTLEQLVQRSGVERAECLGFCEDLRKAGLFHAHRAAQAVPAPSSAPEEKPPLSLLSRIRQRLGI